MLKFYRGPYAKYNPAQHEDGIYFATDKGTILMNRVAYIGPLAGKNPVNNIALNSEGDKFIITYLDGTTSEIEVAKSEYESNIEDKTLAMPSKVGGIAAGTTVAQLEGKTFNEVLDDLLFPTVNPTFTAPSATIARKNYSELQEVGADAPTAANFTTSFSKGAITLNSVKQADRAGAQDTANSYIEVKVAGASTYTSTLPTKVALGTHNYRYHAAYAEGPQPVDNKGGNYSTALAAGTVNSSDVTVKGTYPWYASTSGATVENPLVKQSLIAWNATAGQMTSAEFTLLPSGTVPQTIALPKQRTIATMQMYDTSAEKWKSVGFTDFGTPTTKAIDVNGESVTYNVYTYAGAARGEVKLKITF